MDKRLRPERWDISPALSSTPELWRDAWAVYPCWDVLARDYSPERNQSTANTITALKSTPFGTGLFNDNALSLTLPSTPFGGTDPCSFHYCGVVDAMPLEAWLFSEATEIILRLQASGAFGFILNSFSSGDRATTATGIASPGDFFYATGTYDGTTLSVFATVNGKTFTASSTPSGTYANSGSSLLVISQPGPRPFRGTTLYFEVTQRACTLDEHIQRALDPFSLIRPANDFYVPAIFGDLGAPAGDIDTAEKRRSVSGIWLPLLPGVTPNATPDAEWRAEAGWSYSGITYDTPAVVDRKSNNPMMVTVGRMMNR